MPMFSSSVTGEVAQGSSRAWRAFGLSVLVHGVAAGAFWMSPPVMVRPEPISIPFEVVSASDAVAIAVPAPASVAEVSASQPEASLPQPAALPPQPMEIPPKPEASSPARPPEVIRKPSRPRERPVVRTVAKASAPTPTPTPVPAVDAAPAPSPAVDAASSPAVDAAPAPSPAVDAAPVAASQPAASVPPTVSRMGNPALSGSDGLSRTVAEDRLPDVKAAMANNPKPDYPRSARRLGQEGIVLLTVEVTAAGGVAGVGVRKSSGFESLDQAATEAVRHWRFIPARRNGLLVAATVSVPIRFALQAE
ncbi:MAG: TonB family protein [Magnetococcales bacterium]|nr:TonB family protein [Magnetococcales bacterium]